MLSLRFSFTFNASISKFKRSSKRAINLKITININKYLFSRKKLIIAVQINGKLKNTIEIEKKDASDKALHKDKDLALNNIKNAIINNAPKKIIVIPGKVINIVI